MSHVFLEGDAFKPAKPLVVNGTREMLSEGIAALENMQRVSGEGIEVAEIRIYENTPIEAVVSIEEDDIIIDTQTWAWNGSAWLRP
jgi:hypothetical protein